MIRQLKKAVQITKLCKYQPILPFSTELYDPNRRDELKSHHWIQYDPSHQNSVWTHKSNAEQLIHKVPVIYVEQDVVRCIVQNIKHYELKYLAINGGSEINAGHPQVYIQLNTRKEGKIQTCKYCGLRFAKKSHDQSHNHH